MKRTSRGLTARALAVAVLALLLAAGATRASAAQATEPGAWLETAPPLNWNTAGAAVPAAPPPYAAIDPRCGAMERPSESPEEDQVIDAGWRLFNAARVGWGLREVDALVDYDGMCRPNQFQGFIFVDGQFAGTIAPAPMDSRTDGAGRVLDVRGPAMVTGQFVRYTATDPLCCPSSVFFVEYTIDRTLPLLVPQRATRTQP